MCSDLNLNALLAWGQMWGSSGVAESLLKYRGSPLSVLGKLEKVNWAMLSTKFQKTIMSLLKIVSAEQNLEYVTRCQNHIQVQ